MMKNCNHIKLFSCFLIYLVFGVIKAFSAENHCDNLHKAEGIDDLLAQMYSNINTHCIFEMPSEELERIWGIKIFDYISKNYKEIDNKIYEERKKYSEEVSAVYLIRFSMKKDNALEESGEYFMFFPTEKFVEKYDLWNSRLDQGLLTTLPPPDNEKLPKFYMGVDYFIDYAGSCSVSEENKKYDFYFKCDGDYYWWNFSKSTKLPYLKMSTSRSVSPHVIKFCKTANCY